MTSVLLSIRPDGAHVGPAYRPGHSWVRLRRTSISRANATPSSFHHFVRAQHRCAPCPQNPKFHFPLRSFCLVSIGHPDRSGPAFPSLPLAGARGQAAEGPFQLNHTHGHAGYPLRRFSAWGFWRFLFLRSQNGPRSPRSVLCALCANSFSLFPNDETPPNPLFLFLQPYPHRRHHCL
jgi:hypothetical protein